MRSNTCEIFDWSIDNNQKNNTKSIEDDSIYKINSTKENGKQVKDNLLNLDRSLQINDQFELDTNSIKLANRAIRAKIPHDEYQELLDMRNKLVEKKFSSGISKNEELKLQMLRWQIEGIEDALIGPQLDQLELLANSQERLAEMINEFNDQVKKIIKKKN